MLSPVHAWHAVQAKVYAWHAVQVTYCRNSKTLCTQNMFVCVLQARLALVALRM